jgi:hypothetical protein
MKGKFLFLFLLLFLLTGCLKHDFSYETSKQAQINENVSRIFGTTFDENQDWSVTSTGSVLIKGIPSNINKVQVLVYINESDGETSINVLNESEVNNETELTLNYDAPNDNLGLFVSFSSNNWYSLVEVKDGVAEYSEKSKTRVIETDYTLPSVVPTLESVESSYAVSRNWLEKESLFNVEDYESLKMPVEDYDDGFKTIFNAIVFSYFKNGRNYNNLPLVKNSGYYNDNAYPITTGDEPIIISPVYKCDKAKQYGNEVWNSDLYYYYFKEADMEGKNPVEFINSLPKYKVIPFNKHFGEEEDNNLSKRTAYALMYFGDGIPELNTEGSFKFPKGYKIGFMVKANTKSEAPKKQGELYGDGRLNNNINKWPNFSSSKLGTDGPRVAWLTINGKTMMCWESGTDSDFNDIILEVEGGFEPINIIPEFESNYYTFCFEDTELGDYDMNDVVIKARRIDKTNIEYSIVACGALDELLIKNINGRVINENTEVHRMFNSEPTYINTFAGQNTEPVTETIKVSSNFSFLDVETQPYIVDISTGAVIKLAKRGEDPHGIMIPYDFKYPVERVCIKDAYPQFNSWGKNSVTSTEWYKFPNEEVVL